MDSKPLWIEQFLDDAELFEFFKRYLKMTESLIPKLEYCIDLEKHNVKAKEAKVSRSIASIIVKDVATHKILLQSLERSQFLSTSNIVEEYRQKLQHIQDKAKEITIRENLKWTT